MYVFVPGHVVLRAEPSYFNGWIAFNSKLFQTVYLNYLQLMLLEELKSCTVIYSELEVIWDGISNGHPVLISALLECGILQCSETALDLGRQESILLGLPGRYTYDPNAVNLSSPAELELCLTRRCNQTCIHCNVSAVSLNASERAETEFWLRIVDQAAENRVLRITLTGGEPFVRSDIGIILRHIVKRPLGCIILTNAMHISDEHMQIMSGNPVSLSVSLDGVNAEQHDEFRRTPGAFANTIKTMERLRDYNIPFVISSVLHAKSVDSAIELVELADRLGASRVIVVPMASVGRAKTQPAAEYFPDSLRLRASLERVREFASSTPGLDIVIGSGDPDLKELLTIRDRHTGATAMSKRNPGLCKAGVYSMAIDADGMAYSCLRGLQERIHPIGNLKDTDLGDVWRSSSWSQFRDLSIPMVPCRVEHLANNAVKTKAPHH